MRIYPLILILLCGCQLKPISAVQPVLRTASLRSVIAPQPLASVSIVQTNLTLAWNATPDATSYTIYYGVTPNEYDATNHLGNVTHCTLTGFSTGRTYHFSVTSENDTEQSDFAADYVFSTPAILDLHFPNPGSGLLATQNFINWYPREAKAIADGWQLTVNPAVPMEFYKPNL